MKDKFERRKYKRSKKKALLGITCSLTLFMGAVPALAAWSGIVTVAIPPWGQTIDVMGIGVVKTTSTSSFSVYGVRETNTLDPHAMLINSEHQSRSNWCPVRQNEYTSAYSSAMVNYYSYSRAGSNALEPNRTNIQYQFNPY